MFEGYQKTTFVFAFHGSEHAACAQGSGEDYYASSMVAERSASTGATAMKLPTGLFAGSPCNCSFSSGGATSGGLFSKCSGPLSDLPFEVSPSAGSSAASASATRLFGSGRDRHGLDGSAGGSGSFFGADRSDGTGRARGAFGTGIVGSGITCGAGGLFGTSTGSGIAGGSARFLRCRWRKQ